MQKEQYLFAQIHEGLKPMPHGMDFSPFTSLRALDAIVGSGSSLYDFLALVSKDVAPWRDTIDMGLFWVISDEEFDDWQRFMGNAEYTTLAELEYGGQSIHLLMMEFPNKKFFIDDDCAVGELHLISDISLRVVKRRPES